MHLAIAGFQKGVWTPRQTICHLGNAVTIQGAHLVLVEDFFKIEAVVPTQFHIAMVANVAPKYRVVRIGDDVLRVSRGKAIFGEDNQRAQLGGSASEARPPAGAFDQQFLLRGQLPLGKMSGHDVHSPGLATALFRSTC